MVFFNDPVPVDEHELRAVEFALAARERFVELARAWTKRGTELGLGIGIEAGYATLGWGICTAALLLTLTPLLDLPPESRVEESFRQASSRLHCDFRDDPP